MPATKACGSDEPKPLQKETVRPRVVRIKPTAVGNKCKPQSHAQEQTTAPSRSSRTNHFDPSTHLRLRGNREGEAAKKKLMAGATLASAKMNYAQKKTRPCRATRFTTNTR